MQKYHIICCIWLTYILAFSLCDSYYSIIAPGVMKSNRKYTVVTSLHEADEPAVMRLSIDGPSFAATQDVLLQPYETKRIHFEASELEPGNYNLTAEGISGIEFRNQSTIFVEHNAGPKIYIQTDRTYYKPADLVRFRVVMLDEHTKPARIRRPIRIEILDASYNRVKQFNDITLIKGVYTNSFRIPKYPSIGGWILKVIVRGNHDYTRSKLIHVREYVLPKFCVYIKTDRHFVVADNVLRASVYGKYTFDKFVEGNATATLVEPYENVILQQKTLNVSGITDLEFRFDNPNDLTNLQDILLQVELQEKHTGMRQSDSETIEIKTQRYRISASTEGIAFRNNIPCRIKAKIMHWNDTAVLDHATPFVMQHGSKDYVAYLDGNGEAEFEFDHETDENHVFRFMDTTYVFYNILSHDNIVLANDTQSFITMTLKGDKPLLGSELEIEISSPIMMSYFVYTIVSHGDIVRMENIKVPDQQIYTLRIMPTIEMAPTSVLYIHYLHDGYFCYKEMELHFPLDFENQISVIAPTEVTPGQEVTINLKAQRKSYVSILAVDLSVHLLDSSYDLRRMDILRDLDEDQTYLPFAALVYPGLLSGVLTFTNAHYNFVGLEGVSNHQPSFTKQWHPRKKFPETWIFQNYEITDENTAITLTMPEVVTTWRITAFSVHEVTGFGMVKAPTDIVSFKPFFLNVHLPYSVKREENVTIPIAIYNYHNQTLDTELTLYNRDMEFHFIKLNSTQRKWKEVQATQHVQVPANDFVIAKFSIAPKQVGEITLHIAACNSLFSDVITQKLRVEPEGEAKVEAISMFVSAPASDYYSTTLTLNIPLNIVPDSEHIALFVGGESLVPHLENLNAMLYLPSGCGEQNIAHFAVNTLVLDYLKSTLDYSKNKRLVGRAKQMLDAGYQQQMSCRCSNGGYTAGPGQPDEEASTWLTAYVTRFFIKAAKYVTIEDDIINEGLEFLASTQTWNGDFQVTGYLFHPELENRFSFTAFVLMTFLEEGKYASNYSTTISGALDFLNTNLEQINDAYSLSIVATALQMAKHLNVLRLVNRLDKYQHFLYERKWWSESIQTETKDIDITAYTLSALLGIGNNATDDSHIVQWLLEQRNELGIFNTTHSTVVTLQTLMHFADKYSNLKNLDLKVKYLARNHDQEIMQQNELFVDGDNALLLQAEELPQSTRSIDIQIHGSGYTLVQLSYRYHVIDEDDN